MNNKILTTSSIYKISINELRPTQISVGFEQVIEKEKKISLKKQNLDKYLKRKLVPAIIGPHKQIYIIDHHHLSRAIYNLNLDYIYYKILEDWSKLSENDFWNKMKEHNYIWLYNYEGKIIDLDTFKLLLPKYIKDLKNDAFRSLAGIIRHKNGFIKTWTPYSEFIWANFFRNSNLNLEINALNISDSIINQAMLLAKSNAAKDLPEYITLSNI